MHWVSDFQALNKALKCRCCPLPKIQEILSHHKGHKFLSELDLLMHHCFSSWTKKESIFVPLQNHGACSTVWVHAWASLLHLTLLKKSWNVFWLLLWKKLKCTLTPFQPFWVIGNLILFFLKICLPHCKRKVSHLTLQQCEWGIQETIFLGHWLAPEGVKPWCKKIDAIPHVEPPANIEELHSLLGMVVHHWDMWLCCSHILAPLTSLLKVKEFQWGLKQQQVLIEMKALMARHARAASMAIKAFISNSSKYSLR